MTELKLSTLGLGGLSQAATLFQLALLGLLLFWLIRLFRRRKYAGAALTAATLALVLYSPVKTYIAYREFMARYEPAKALFDEKCKNTAPRIKRRVEGEVGIVLLKLRTQDLSKRDQDLHDPMWADAALPKENFGEGYVLNFLRDRQTLKLGPNDEPQARRIVAEIGGSGERGFSYVDVIDAKDNQRYRLSARPRKSGESSHGWGGDFVVNRKLADTAAPRFAVSHENNVDPALRKYWVAGTTIQVIDQVNGEVIAEQEFWTFDQSQGNGHQGSPWLTSVSHCPNFGSYGSWTQQFVDTVIMATQGK